MQSFVAIEAFEVRHEILVRLQDVAPTLELGAAESIEIEEQGSVKERIAELVTTSYLLEVDGTANEGILERIDFMTVDAQGVLPRPVPVRENVSEGFVGVTTVHVTPSTPKNVTLTWRSFEVVTEIPATVTDPEVSRATLLTGEEPSLRWVNELAEDPASSVTAIAVEPTRLPIPLLSLPFLAIALVFLVGGVRRSRSPHSLVIARVALAVALVIGPLGDVAVALPFSPAPTEAQARRILAGILPNVYRAFELREESAAYDRLSVSVTGDTLTEVYLEHRRALEMEERGGARARVEAVEVIGVSEVLPEPDGGFDAEASWSVGGTVTHFGHRHFRQNRYQARAVVVPVDGFWKIRSIDIIDEERIR